MFVEGDPGDRISRDLVVKNQTVLDVRVTASILDMEEGPGNSQAAEFVAIGEARRGAGAWIEPLETDRFVIPARTERTIDVVIEIPDDAGHGGHYAALMFVADDPRPDGQFPINQTVPVPVLVTVRGDFQRELRVGVVAPERWRWRGGRATWTVELYNAGDVHEVLAGRIRVDGALSGAASRPIRQAILLPGERRRQRISFDVRDAPDLIAAQVRVERDEGRPVEATARRMLVLPWWLLVIVALAALVVTWRLRTRDGANRRDPDPDDERSWDPSPPVG